MRADPDVATGPGPAWLRWALVGVALIYFWGLARESAHKLFGTDVPEHGAWLQPAIFFTQATALFPQADEFAIEARLDAWVCETQSWQPLDPRPYFSIEADDKESRLQRLAFFYPRVAEDRVVMHALDDYIRAKHAAGADDGVHGAIGGIRLYERTQPIPPPGEPPLHYEFDPFSPVPPEQHKDKFYTKASDRKARCSTH